VLFLDGEIRWEARCLQLDFGDRSEKDGRNARLPMTNQRRSERVFLQIKVIVEVEREHGNPARVDAFTVVVNAHGGLLEMSAKVSKGQKLFLSNPSAGTRQSARVVAVRRADEDGFAVAFEFDDPAPRFWPIPVPPENWHAIETDQHGDF
jgi:hypothetical protein